MPEGWILASAACDDGSPAGSIALAPGETVTCTFTNRRLGAARVVKMVSGARPAAGQSFAFELRQGASPLSAGTVFESEQAAAGNGGIVTFAAGLAPGLTYALCETLLPGWTTTLGPPLFSTYNPGGNGGVRCADFTVLPGETKTFAVDNRPPTENVWCDKQSVRDVLNPATGRFSGNLGPDVIVRTDLNQSLQQAVDAVTDTNGDGYLLVAVVGNGARRTGGNSSQAVVVSRSYEKPFGLFGCSVTLKDAAPLDALPPIWVRSSAASPTNIFLMSLHGFGSPDAGILVEGNGRVLREVDGNYNRIGVRVVGDGNTLQNLKVANNSGDGISIQGSANVLMAVEAHVNGGDGIDVAGNANELLMVHAGDKKRGNAGDGIHLVGDGNLISESRDLREHRRRDRRGRRGQPGHKGGGGRERQGQRPGRDPRRRARERSRSEQGKQQRRQRLRPARRHRREPERASGQPEQHGRLRQGAPRERRRRVPPPRLVRSAGGNRADNVVVPKTTNPPKCSAFPAVGTTTGFGAPSPCE